MITSLLKPKKFATGGIHPAENKISQNIPISTISLPTHIAIPLSSHLGAPAETLVSPGDIVKVGQLIAKATGFVSANIHSSVSGTVKQIDTILDASGYKKSAIIIQVEGDVWGDSIDRSSKIITDFSLTPEQIKQKILEAGIVGLGGATFPAHVKLAIPEGKKAELLIINGVECEPALTSDHRLMLEHGEEILTGIRLLMHAINVKHAIIGIELNKPDAIEHLSKLARKYPGITVQPLKVQYPQGAERQLVEAITKREVPPPPKGLPIDVGCVVFNVGTCFAIYEAIQKHKPLFERVVTVTGENIKQPANFLVRMGTSIRHLIEQCGGIPENTGKVISGGPMMGKALASFDVPVTKGTSGVILIPEKKSKRDITKPCIRCAKCVQSCALGLEPYLLMALVEKKLYDRAEEEKVVYCCECGCCSYDCPSKRPLLDYIRSGKAVVLQNMRARTQK